MAFVIIGEFDRGNGLVQGQATIRAAYSLIPHELYGVTIVTSALINLSGARHRRSVGANQMIGAKCIQFIKPAQQNAWVAVFLAANGENIEQRRPQQVVNRQFQLGKPNGRRVRGIGWRGIKLYRQTGNRRLHRRIEGVQGGQVAVAERGMIGIAKKVAQPHIDYPVRAFCGHGDGELVYQPTRHARGNFTAETLEIGLNTGMPPYG